MGKYFNSDLNKYIGENLPRIMTTIDIDLFQVKLSRKIIRFAEYKHTNEKIGVQQLKALKQLAKIANVVNKNSKHFEDWKLQVLIIRGDEPYDFIEITDLIKDKKYTLKNKEIINKILTLTP